MVNRSSRQPGLRYVSVAEDLRERIEAGEFKPDDRLPGQHQLARSYGVSLTTLRSAIELLEARRYLRSEHGLGTFVTPPESRSRRALVIDDDPAAIELFKVILEGEDIQTVGATSRSEALEQVGSNQFDIIFLDLVMPGGSGVDTLATFQETGVSTPVVLVTGAADAAMISQAMEFGPLTLIRKPVAVKQVRQLLDRMRFSASSREGAGA